MSLRPGRLPPLVLGTITIVLAGCGSSATSAGTGSTTTTPTATGTPVGPPTPITSPAFRQNVMANPAVRKMSAARANAVYECVLRGYAAAGYKTIADAQSAGAAANRIFLACENRFR